MGRPGSRRARMVSTNTSLPPDKVGGVSCAAYVLLIGSILLLIVGGLMAGMGYGLCVQYTGCTTFTGLRAAGILTCVAGVVAMSVMIILFCCVIKPTCCGFQMSEKRKAQYRQHNRSFDVIPFSHRKTQSDRGNNSSFMQQQQLNTTQPSQYNPPQPLHNPTYSMHSRSQPNLDQLIGMPGYGNLGEQSVHSALANVSASYDSGSAVSIRDYTTSKR